jgi:maltose O-acetyltransferase
MTERDKMAAGELYVASDPELVRARSRARRLVKHLSEVDPDDLDARNAALSDLLGSMASGVYVAPPLFVDYGFNVSLGARTYLNAGCILLDCNRIDVGEDVLIGPAVHVYTATHPVDPDERGRGLERALAVRIESRVWIGGAAVILPGVTVGEGATIGAGSVVTSDVPPRCVAAGNPCRVLRRLG